MTLARSLTYRAWIALAVVASLVALGFSYWPAEAAGRSQPKITYIECGPGGVHVWVFPDGSGAVMPAGAECPK